MRCASVASSNSSVRVSIGFAPIFPDICYHLTHY
ncbi:traY domain protein, partial [Shigella dysenteriae]